MVMVVTVLALSVFLSIYILFMYGICYIFNINHLFADIIMIISISHLFFYFTDKILNKISDML